MRLPTECLLLVFDILARDEDTRTLSTLLRVSKTIQAMVLPLLYQEPLWIFRQERRMEHTHHDIEGRLQQYHGQLERQLAQQQRSRKQRRFARGDAFSLIRMLLGCVVDKSVMSDFIKIAYKLDGYERLLGTPVSDTLPNVAPVSTLAEARVPLQTEVPLTTKPRRLRLAPHRTMLTGPPSIDYLAFLKQLRVNYFIQGDDRWQQDLRSFCNKLDPEQLANHQHATLLTGIHSRGFHYVAVARQINDILSMDLTWALCNERLEQLQSLTIYLEDLGRYQNVADRLPLLSRVCFEQGREAYLAAKTDLEKQEIWQSMVLFVERHTLAFGTLREVDYPACPPSVRVLLWRALPVVQDPRVIDATNWVRFHAQADRTRMDRVIKIQIPAASFSFLREHLETLKQGEPYLHRCRMLERYEMPFLDSAVDSFKWAVEEKLEAGYTRQDPNTPTTLPLAISLPLHSGSSRLNRPRVMVKHIITQADTGVLDSWLEDVAFAFSQSLETLTARDDVSNSHLQGILGTQWNLPRLRQLEIQRRRRSVHFDTGALVHSPLLEELVLRDHPTYLNEIDWDTVALQEPLRLSKLRVLRLKGIPAITFHPHSFLTSRDVKDDGDYPGMPDLHTLSLDVNGSLNSSPTYALTQIATPAPPRLTMERSDVPEGPTTRRAWEMLQDRSLWAWNWDLPHLTVMELRGEFGLYFDMAMLQRTPGLEVLCLDIWSRFLPPEAQARTLDLSELTIAMGRSDEAEGTQDNGDNNDDRKQMELLVLPRLTHLHLEGPWTIDGQTLKILFTQVMPNLVCISESGCQGFDLREWMKATAKLPKLLSANMRKIKAQDSPLMAIQDFGLRAEEIPSGGGGGVGVDIETLVNVVLKIKSSMELSILTNWWPLVDRQQALKERGVVEYLFGGSVFTRARHGGRFP